MEPLERIQGDQAFTRSQKCACLDVHYPRWCENGHFKSDTAMGETPIPVNSPHFTCYDISLQINLLAPCAFESKCLAIAGKQELCKAATRERTFVYLNQAATQ